MKIYPHHLLYLYIITKKLQFFADDRVLVRVLSYSVFSWALSNWWEFSRVLSDKDHCCVLVLSDRALFKVLGLWVLSNVHSPLFPVWPVLMLKNKNTIISSSLIILQPDLT